MAMKEENLLWLFIAGAVLYLVFYRGTATTAAAEPELIPMPKEKPSGVPLPGKTIRRTLKIGMKGDDVRVLQRALIKAKYPVSIDGIYGKITAAVVARFQKAHGLVADGIAGPKTQAALGL